MFYIAQASFECYVKKKLSLNSFWSSCCSFPSDRITDECQYVWPDHFEDTFAETEGVRDRE